MLTAFLKKVSDFFNPIIEGQSISGFVRTSLPGEKQPDLVVLDYVQAQYPELCELIKNTESMDNEEKNYWYANLLAMTDRQIESLTHILTTEKEKLAELEEQYEKDIAELNAKHIAEWELINGKKITSEEIHEPYTGH